MTFWQYAAIGLLLVTDLEAVVTTQTVRYADGNVQLEGFVAYPDGTGPFPVVLHVHQWAGLSDFERERANRTAAELGHVGFAVSIYDVNETAAAAASMQGRIPLVGKYTGAPELIVSRLAAAVNLMKADAKVDGSKIAAVGYCFGGSAVLHFARLGGASAAGVPGVVSFHGALSGVGASDPDWQSTKVLILNGAADNMIPKGDVDAVQASLNGGQVTWEFTNYGHAGHGFTHPTDGSAHFHYDAAAEERSWSSMSDFLDNQLGFKESATTPEPLVTEEVTYMDGDVTLTGYIAYRASLTGTAGVVLHVHQWSGLSDFEKGRANRTAEELGYIGFAVSVYDVNETAAAVSMQARIPLVQKYTNAPELVVSRLAAAVAFVKQHVKADVTKIAAAGYCFGGSSVLQFARLGGAATSGVSSVLSFHGSLGGVVNKASNFCPTRVAVYNGAKDPMISDAELQALQQALEGSKTYWELTNYSFAGHGFTHPTEVGNDHFHFEKTAERRSWNSMAHLLRDTFEGKGAVKPSDCVEFVPAGSESEPAPDGVGDTDCMDDDAGVEAVAGQWGVTKCAADQCEGQFKDMMQPLCKKTCGLCKSDASSTTAPSTQNESTSTPPSTETSNMSNVGRLHIGASALVVALAVHFVQYREGLSA